MASAGVRAELIEGILGELRAGSGVALVGEPGIGKSAVAGQLVDALGDSHVVLPAIGRRSTVAVPMGAFEAHLPPEVDSIRAALALLREQALADGRPVLLHVDDADQLDEASAFIAHALAATPGVTTLLGYRDGGDVPPSVAQIRTDGLVRERHLEPLNDDDVQRLAAARLGGALGPSTAQRLCDLVRGNPLFVDEVVTAGLRSGALVQQGATWHWTGGWRADLRLDGIVDERLRSLPDEQREVLELVALAEPVAPEALLVALDAGDLRPVDDLERLELIRLDGSGELVLTNPLHGDLLRAQLPALRRRRLAAALARLPMPDRPDRRQRAVQWRLDAGVAVSAEDLLSAATSAYRAEAYETSADLARRAVDAGARTRGGYLLGISLDEMGRAAEGIDALDEAWQADDGGDEALLLVGLARSESELTSGGDVDLALRHLADLRARVPAAAEHAAAAEVLALLAASRPDDALALVEPLLDSPDEVVATMALPAVLALAVVGRGDEAVAFAEQGLAVRSAVGPREGMARAAVFGVAVAWALSTCGRLRDAAAAAQLGYRVALDMDEAAGQAWFAIVLGDTALAAGDPAAAEAWYGEAAATFASRRRPAARWAWATMAYAAAVQGAPGRGDEPLALLESAPPTCWHFLDPLVDRAVAWHDWAAGDLGAARVRLDAGRAAASAASMWWLEGVLLVDQARFGVEVRPHLADLAGKVADPRPGLWATALDAIDLDEWPTVTTAATDLEALGARMEAADLLALAAAARWAQDPTGATELAAAARAVVDTTVVRSPALAALPGVPELPDGVRTVAQLAATGSSSKAIAEELVLSVRTVDNQLGKAFKAFGVSSRQELAPLLAAWFGTGDGPGA